MYSTSVFYGNCLISNVKYVSVLTLKKSVVTICTIRFNANTYAYFHTQYVVGTINTGLFEMIVGVLTTCHTQYT